MKNLDGDKDKIQKDYDQMKQQMKTVDDDKNGMKQDIDNL